MIFKRTLIVFIFFLSIPFYANSASIGYQPLGAKYSNGYALGEDILQFVYAPTADGNRPILPGVNGRNLELLQDAVARKYTRVTEGSSLPVARNVLARTRENTIPSLRGAMAEALFLDKHPEWGYVNKPNAPQHDVFAKMPNGGQGIRTGQVKFHMSGDPAVYARDMIKDWRSGSFLIPDDHVDSLRIHLKAHADKLYAAGEPVEASAYYRHLNRVKRIGATSAEIDKATRQAIAEARVVRVAPYVLLGAAAALIVAPTAWDWYRGEIESSEAAYRFTRAGSTFLSAAATDIALKHWRGGLLRGTVRGSIIISCVVIMVDASWQAYEYGGFGNVVENPDFLIHLGGSISAAACGLAGGYVGMIGGAKAGGVIGSFFGPGGVPIGASLGGGLGGLVFGSAAGMAGYWGGAQGTRWVIETFYPEKVHEEERRFVRDVQKEIQSSITALQKM